MGPNNCIWTWTTLNGVKGDIVYSKKTGNRIFLPAAGSRSDGNLSDVGTYGHYWSSSLYTDELTEASYVYFNSDNVSWSSWFRCYGRSVRPVSDY